MFGGRGRAAWSPGAALLLAWLVAGIGVSPGVAAEAERIAVFDFDLVDTSLGGELRGTDPADEARLRMIGAELRERLGTSARFEVVPVGSAAADIRRDLRDCVACALDVAEELGADLAAIGWVQKVSNLILNMNLVIHATDTGDRVFASGVDLRGNTDESWRRGLRYIVEHELMEN